MIAIVFDIDDTLYDQMLPFSAAFNICFKGRYEVNINRLYSLYRKYSDEIFADSQNGVVAMSEMYIYRLSKAMEELGIKVTEQEALDFQEHYAKYQKEIYLSEEMMAILDICKAAKVKMGILSNGPTNHQAGKVAQLEADKWFAEEFTFISGALGVMKPEVGIFEHVEAVMGVSKSNFYMVGDSYRNDIIGASNAGWNTIWLNRRDEVVGSQAIIDYSVKNERELRTLIEQILG